MITSFLPHHMPFMWMPSKPVYIAYQFENAINTTILYACSVHVQCQGPGLGTIIKLLDKS